MAKNITDRVDNPQESGLENYIGLEHLDTDEIRIKRYGSPTEVEATKFLCKKGDIIFGKRRAYLRKLAVTSRDAVVSAHSMVLRAKEDKVDPDFLPWFMQSSQFWKTAFAISEGSLSPTIKWKTLSTQEFWLPSKLEQKKIAEILWGIEDNIQETENLIQVAEKLKKGLLEELLTKGIGHKKFRKTELGEIPEEWIILTIGDICSVRRGSSPRPIGDKKYFSEKGPGWIRISDITPVYKYVRKTEQCLSEEGASCSVVVGKGDLVMSICATIGKPVIIDMNACIHDGFVLFQAIRESILVEYLFYVLLKYEKYFKSQKQEGTQGNLNTSIVANTLIAIPNEIEEQKKIISVLNNVDSVIENLNNTLRKCGNMQKKLLNDFLTGELQIQSEAT